MDRASAVRGNPRQTASRCLRSLMVPLLAALALVLHHGLDAPADPMPDHAMVMAVPVGPTPAAAKAASAKAAAPGRDRPAAAAHCPGTTGGGCSQAHCAAPDARPQQFIAPPLLPIGFPFDADGAASMGAAPYPHSRGPSPPRPTTLCVLRT